MSGIRAILPGLCLFVLCGSGLAQLSDTLPVSARSPADYVALRDRPLFSPERQAPRIVVAVPAETITPEVLPEPAPEVFVEQDVVMEAPDWELVGLVRSSRIVSATFRTPNQSNAFSLRKGESRDGWTLADVRSTEVVLDGEGGQALIRFRSLR